MSQQRGGEASGGSGFNTAVEYEGQRYHVQTQCSTRDAPVIESLVFQDGRTLVRITSSYGDVADRLGFTEDDGRHLLELQHADLIRKIRHGMLRSDAAVASPEDARLLDVEGRAIDPAEIEDPSVQELLRELGHTVDKIATPPQTVERVAPASPRHNRFRFAIRIVLPF